MRELTKHEIARAKIAQEYYDLAIKIAKSIAYKEYLHIDIVTGPAMEGLMDAADAIALKPLEIRDYKTYISASVRNSISAFLTKENKNGFTGIEEGAPNPTLLSTETEMSYDKTQTLGDTIPDKDDFEKHMLLQDEIDKSLSRLSAESQEVMKLKREDPLASNSEIAEKLGKQKEQ